MKEVEILVEVFGDNKTILKKLKKFDFQGMKKTLDIYFYDPKRSDLKFRKNYPLKACFRLRDKDGKFFMAYKKDNFDKTKKWLYSDEHEVEVSNLRIAENIVEHLGLKRLVEIDNKKYTFLTKDYEIVFEDVKDLGFFLEVEKLKVRDRDDVKKIKQKIWKFIESLDLEISDELNYGKPDLMLRKIDFKYSN